MSEKLTYKPQRLSFEYVKEEVEKEGYKLLSKEYINSHTKLEVICPNGHIFKKSWDNWKSGQRCKFCPSDNAIKKKKNKYLKIKEEVEKEGYKLLSKEYINSHTKLKFQCPNGHIYDTYLYVFKNGHRCKKCADKKAGEYHKLSFQNVRDYIKSIKGYKLLSKEYINSHTKLKFQCPNGHIFEMSFSSFKTGHRCSVCWERNKTSKTERYICNYVRKHLKNKIISNDRTQIVNPKTNKNLELDIWIPDLNKAIEYNGIYWHSNKYSKYKDIQKIKQCKEKNIDLLVIQEEDWLNDKNNVLLKLKNFLTTFK